MPRHDRDANIREPSAAQNESVFDEDDAMEEAAQALRQAEVEAVQPGDSGEMRESSKT